MRRNSSSLPAAEVGSMAQPAASLKLLALSPHGGGPLSQHFSRFGQSSGKRDLSPTPRPYFGLWSQPSTASGTQRAPAYPRRYVAARPGAGGAPHCTGHGEVMGEAGSQSDGAWSTSAGHQAARRKGKAAYQPAQWLPDAVSQPGTAHPRGSDLSRPCMHAHPQLQGAFFFLAVGAGWIAAGARKARERRRQQGATHPPALPGGATWPPVSVVMPVKGCRPHSRSNRSSHLGLSYPGPLEFIFVVESEEDPAFRELQVCARGIAPALPACGAAWKRRWGEDRQHERQK
jgi:hypothetical protein